MLKLLDIVKVHVELTTKCNARCPMCPRNYRGYNFNSGYPDVELSYTQFQQIFSPEFLKQLIPTDPNWQWGFFFNGNLGDFALASDGIEIVQYLVDHGVQVEINTNGSQRSTAWWAKLAQKDVQIGFALDGLQDTHHLYRQDTNWQKVINNAVSFINAGGKAIWRFIPFDHNKHQEQQCKELAQQLGFYRFENINSGRDRGPVFNRQGEFSHWLGNDQPQTPPTIKNLLEQHTQHIKISPTQTQNVNINCRHKKNREIYVGADGSVYPCCYLGFYPETMLHTGNTQLKPLVRENNALQYGLAHSLSWFDSVEQTWNNPPTLSQCVNSCGI